MAEHFVTIFDHRFAVQGLALHESLLQHCPDAHLRVICLDDRAKEMLEAVAPTGLTTISLREIETPELLEAKKNRGPVEYIYTLTPFTFDAVFLREPGAQRVTYVDADLFFFKTPRIALDRFQESGKDVLLTEHGFAPEYQVRERDSGRFCVQFLTVNRTARANTMVRRWQSQCLESTSTSADGRNTTFGDQKYLEDWPEVYSDAVYVWPVFEEMLAPWNSDHYLTRHGASFRPVFFHFHSFRILYGGWMQLCAGYRIDKTLPLYEAYMASLTRQAGALARCDRAFIRQARPHDKLWLPRLLWRALAGRVVLRRGARW